MAKSLNIIGCGRLGKTLGRLWARAGVFEVSGIVNQTKASAWKASELIGSGAAVDSIAALPPSDFYMISAPDSKIAACADMLSGNLKAGSIVFHCSGTLSSTALGAAKDRGALVASVHPIKSFSSAAASAESFEGTYCATEGDPAAIAVLGPAFEAIGGTVFGIHGSEKATYHAAMVFACNYLVTLIELGNRGLEQAGLSSQRAFRVLEPLVRGTVDNVFREGTVGALTGPIARGDAELIAAHLERLESWKPEYADLYRRLAPVTIEIAEKKGSASAEGLRRIREMIRES